MLDYDGFIYNVVLLLHLLSVIVGFGSSFVWPALAARSRSMEPREAYTLNNLALGLSKGMSSMPIYAAGATGLLLVILSTADDFGPWAFDQTWISIAFALFIIGVLVSIFLHQPNLKRMDELQAALASGGGTPSPGGPPAEVVELEERGKQAAMFGGILHLIFLLLVIDMVWKPGTGF